MSCGAGLVFAIPRSIEVYEVRILRTRLWSCMEYFFRGLMMHENVSPAEARAARSVLYRNAPPPLPVNYEPSPGLREIRLHEIDLYVTMKCNIRCDFCSVRAGEYAHEELSLGQIVRLIDEAVELGLEELHFLGGEPTMRRDLEAMVRHAASRNVATRIITNGMLLPRERIQRLIDAGLGEVMISVDGMHDAHTLLRISGANGWATTMQCIADCVELGIRTRVSTAAYRTNYDDVLPLLDLVNEMGAHCYSVFLGSPLGRGHGMLGDVISPYRWRELQEAVAARVPALRPDLDIIMEAGFQWSDGPVVDRAQLKGRGTGCNTLLEDYDYLIVRSDGNLYQCVFFMTEGKPIGSIAHQKLLPTLQHALERADYHGFTVPQDKCVSCSHQVECGTGCRGYAYLYNGDWLTTDPRCAKTESMPQETPAYYPLCPILKQNVRTGGFGGSSEDALRA